MRLVLFFCMCAWYTVHGQDINAMVNMPKYDARYDYLDVDAIFTNKRLVRNYVDCLINAMRCTPEGKQLKRVLPEALRTKCVRCTERQKKTAVKVIKRLKYEYPDEWAKLSSRWDPTGDFTRYFEEYLAKEDFNTISGSAGKYTPVPSLPPSTPVPTAAPPASTTTVVAPTTRPPATSPPLTNPPVTMPSTPPRPILLNRFGDDGELMVGSSSSSAPTTRPTVAPSVMTTVPSSMRPVIPLTRPTQMTWATAGSNPMPTLFPTRPATDMTPPYTTAITIIDQIGYKIIRTTELVTDILRNTVRAVVG